MEKTRQKKNTCRDVTLWGARSAIALGPPTSPINFVAPVL
jgi:hypothetical protein